MNLLCAVWTLINVGVPVVYGHAPYGDVLSLHSVTRLSGTYHMRMYIHTCNLYHIHTLTMDMLPGNFNSVPGQYTLDSTDRLTDGRTQRERDLM